MKNLFLSICILGYGLSVYGQISSTHVLEAKAQQKLQDPLSITLKPGFWAKSGSVFHAFIDYVEFNKNCPIITVDDFTVAHINPNTYSPDAIDDSYKLLLNYDSAGNTTRIYFANAKAGTDNTNSNYTLAAIASLIYVYPNPTSGTITVSWDDSIDRLIRSAVLVTPNSVHLPLQMEQIRGKRQASLTFSGAMGVYFLQVRLSDNRIASKTIIKN